MDTNLIAAIAAQQHPVPSPAGYNTVLIVVGMIITAVAPTLAAIASYYKSRSTQASVEEAKKMATITAETVEKVHVSVNSERTAMLTTVQNLRDEILRISTDLSASKEQQRGHELAAAKASAPVAQPIFNPIPLPPAAAPVVEQAAAALSSAIKSAEPLKVEDVGQKK